MLKKMKKHIYLFAVLSVMCIVVMLIILDINIFCASISKRQRKISTYTQIEDVYNNVVEKVNNIKNESKEENETSIENKEENLKLGEVNIYSTNKWRIKIPKLNLDAPIMQGTDAESLRRTVGHFEQTDKWEGNVALAAHNRGYKCNFFQDIKKLEKGDIIIYSTEKGERKYKVEINTVIKETDWSYIQNTDDNRITLITCEIDKREYRRCIQAIEVIE